MSRPQFSRRAARPIEVRRQPSVRLSRAPCQESVLEDRSNNAVAPDAQQLQAESLHYLSMTESAGTALHPRPRFHAPEQKGVPPCLFDSKWL